MGGINVQVRSYEPFTKKHREQLYDMKRRSVFLGGLRKGTTPYIIKRDLE